MVCNTSKAAKIIEVVHSEKSTLIDIPLISSHNKDVPYMICGDIPCYWIQFGTSGVEKAGAEYLTMDFIAPNNNEVLKLSYRLFTYKLHGYLEN